MDYMQALLRGRGDSKPVQRTVYTYPLKLHLTSFHVRHLSTMSPQPSRAEVLPVPGTNKLVDFLYMVQTTGGLPAPGTDYY